MGKNEQKKRGTAGDADASSIGNLYATLLYPNATQNANDQKGKNA